MNRDKQARTHRTHIAQAVAAINEKSKEAKYVSIYRNGIEMAACPYCRAPWAPVRNVMPWEGNTRVRYHACRRCGKSFKSIEHLGNALP